MDSFIYLAISIGLVINLVSLEVFGLVAGGLIVPGYLAIYITDPLRIFSTFVIAIVTFTVLRLLGNIMLIYGRRQLVLSVLIAYIINWVLYYYQFVSDTHIELAAVGYIIPGLIAYWMEREGIFETIASAITGAAVTRLILIIITQGRIPL